MQTVSCRLLPEETIIMDDFDSGKSDPGKVNENVPVVHRQNPNKLRVLGLLIKKDLITVVRSIGGQVCNLIFVVLLVLAFIGIIYLYSKTDTEPSRNKVYGLCPDDMTVSVADGVDVDPGFIDSIKINKGNFWARFPEVVITKFDKIKRVLEYDVIYNTFDSSILDFYGYSFFEKYGYFQSPDYHYTMEPFCVQRKLDTLFTDFIFEGKRTFPKFDLQMVTLGMPTTEHHLPEMLNYPQFATFLYACTLTMLASLIIKDICEERENGIHAYLILMGTPRSLYLLAHFISAFLKMWILGLPMALLFLAFHKGFPLFVSNFIFAHIVLSIYMLLSTLIKSPGKISFLGFIIVFAGLMVNKYIPVAATNMTSVYVLSFFVPQIAMIYVRQHVEIVASFGLEFRWFTDGGYAAPLMLMFFYMILQLVFIILLAFYLDLVVPVDATVKRHPLFMFGCKFREEEEEIDSVGDDRLNVESGYFEDPKVGGVVGIEATDVVKRFGNETAVNHVTFKAYEGEVTALLGHNGAGKSTLFGCLTGFITPTCGSITTKDNKSCGYTPQWDPLFPLLNVEEHLEFYGKLKSGSVHKDEVARVIKEVGLVGAEKTQGRNLSGGMKRKLSVGMALIGGSEIVLLDEPTAGMDPMARRMVIDIVNGLKTGRTVLITTHYMDEAELLSDRIIIMCKGELMCNGSADFLKAKLDTGFILTTVLRVNQNKDAEFESLAASVLSVIKKHCPDAKIDGPVGNQFTILLPNGSQILFAGMFEELENRKDELKIDSFGVAANGLEQVFIKITDFSDPEEGETAKKLTADFLEVCNTVERSQIKQLTALVIRKLQYERRSPSHFIIPLLFWLLFIGILIFLASVPFKVDDNQGESRKKHVVTDLSKSPEMTVAIVFGQSFDKNVVNEYFKMFEDELDQYPQITPLLVRDLTELTQLMRNIPTLGFAIELRQIDSNQLLFTIFDRVNYPTGFFAAQNLLSNSILNRQLPKGHIKANFLIGFTNLGTTQVHNDERGFDGFIFGTFCFPLFLPIVFAMSVYLCNVEKNSWSVHMYRLTGTNRIIYWASIYLVDMAFALVLALILLTIIVAIGSGRDMFKTLIYFDAFVGYSYGLLVPALFVLASQAYLLGRYVSSASTAMTMMFFWNTSFCMAYYFLANLIYAEVTERHTTNCLKSGMVNFPAVFVFPMLPFYDLITLKFMLLSGGLAKYSNIEARRILMAVMLFLACSFYVLLMSLEAIIFKIKNNQTKAECSPDTHPDVIKEVNKVDSCNIAEYAIVSKRLKKTFKKQVAVECLSLAIPAKECFGLLGANGAGKSTSFSMLTGTLKPTSGSATVDGFNVEDQPRFGFCPQADAVLMTLTVSENLYLYARLSGRSNGDQCVEILLNLLKLKHRAHNIVKKCSGGEKRRLSVGVSILTNSQVVMLDEPTAGIDPRTRRHVWDLLMAMRATGTSIILSSHSMEECETLCTRIAFLARGKMKGIGTSQHLKSVFGNSYTLKLTIGIQPAETFDKINSEVQTLMGCPSTKSIRGSSVLVFSILKTIDRTWSSLYRDISGYVSQHEEIKEFILVETSLEEAFIATAIADIDNPAFIRDKEARK